jgi:hypothetical protein
MTVKSVFSLYTRIYGCIIALIQGRVGDVSPSFGRDNPSRPEYPSHTLCASGLQFEQRVPRVCSGLSISTNQESIQESHSRYMIFPFLPGSSSPSNLHFELPESPHGPVFVHGLPTAAPKSPAESGLSASAPGAAREMPTAGLNRHRIGTIKGKAWMYA